MRADSQVYSLGAALSATGAGIPIRGGYYAFVADGTAGGATVSLQAQLPDGTWGAVAAFGGAAIQTTATLPYVATPIPLPACVVRAAVSGGTGVSVNASLAGIG
ncbi:hypothetical protein NA66_1004298 [Burkholderia pyrrocinia]|uniref:Uncharacterized protein n=1 Tax=Burkholderia pyrrocinia TaxID=60550 RepID=A0A318ISN8_BURPY|nr:hypothetical protein NA66_1004298 [Burkholderia pyrrocinia]SFW35816.1 hypothetical protein SAMN03159384_01497 [Burkholderia sp. NFACC33-1]SFX90668.1 hypothetical protein SAMN03159408_02566 [Burkholderia sp. NFPP32]